MNEKELYKLLAKHVHPIIERHEDKSDVEWLKAAVMTNFALLQNYPHTWKHLLRLKKMLPADELKEFREKIDEFRAPWTISDHGYVKTLTHWKMETLTGRFENSYALLADLGRDHFLTSGTLLGFVREGDVLAHDDDIDFGIMLNGDTLEEVVADLFVLKRELFERKVLENWDLAPNRAFARLKSNKIHIDLFPSFIVDGKLHCWPHGIIEVDDMLPLEVKETKRGPLSFPARPDAVLTAAYGENWRTPDRTYSYPWDRTLKIFEDYHAEYRRQLADNLDLYPGRTLD